MLLIAYIYIHTHCPYIYTCPYITLMEYCPKNRTKTEHSHPAYASVYIYSSCPALYSPCILLYTTSVKPVEPPTRKYTKPTKEVLFSGCPTPSETLFHEDFKVYFCYKRFTFLLTTISPLLTKTPILLTTVPPRLPDRRFIVNNMLI